MENRVVDYYINDYDEEKRLSEGCDNRHTVEREVKKSIIEKYLPEKGSILDIGAGTGLYSVHFAQKGYKVSACDIVPKHVDIIKEKSEKLNLNIDARIADALNVPYEDESYDLVLLSGPIYHLKSVEEKTKAISEAVRCCKKNGIVVVDFLSQIQGFINRAILDEEYFAKLSDAEIDDIKCEDVVFSFDRTKNIGDIFNKLGLKDTKYYGTDSITRFIKKDINWFGPKALDNWIKFILKISDDPEVIGLSEHCLAIGRKK